MKHSNGFFITVASNASPHVYPNNKIWHFRTKLAKPIVLNGAYEVGLIEIQYPRNWQSFPKSDACITITGPNNKTYSLELTLGFYDTIYKLVKEINYHLANNEALAHINLQYNNITNKIHLFGAEGFSFIFKARLAEMLGFHPGVPFKADKTSSKQTPAPHPSDIYGGCYNIFIYSDIIDYQLVGDSHVPLLRCLNIANDSRSIPTITYDKPHYASLSKSVLDDIEIALKNDQNQYIPFLYGKVILKLHFKPIKTSF